MFVSLWNPQKHQISIICLGIIFSAVIGRVFFGFSTLAFTWVVFAGVRAFLIPVIGAINQTIWQKNIPAPWQGRVFGARRLFAQGLYPLALLFGGSLAEKMMQLWPYKNNGIYDGLMALFLIIGLLEAIVGSISWVLLQKKITKIDDSLLINRESLNLP